MLLPALQGRLFVTRDQKLAMRRDVGGSVYLLNSNDAAGQLAELSRHFGIRCAIGRRQYKLGMQGGSRMEDSA